jgi:capsular polysaccharide biosynthesis protein
MRKKLLIPLLTLALFVTVAAWAMQPMTVAPEATGSTTVTGRVTSVDASARSVTIETTNGPAELRAIMTGDQVQIQLAGAANTDQARPVKPTPARRLLGGWLLAMTGTVIVLRARRTRTV